ncbi:MAG: MarR family transcriptional regulator, partial [Clostridia bacterium]|nr:MarR family transcriptional regulator [Clostridia bacterium]
HFPHDRDGERGGHGEGPRHGREPGEHMERGPHGHPERHGFHGPVPFEDDGSLSTLFFRCAHEMHRPDGRNASQGRVMRILSQHDGLSQRELQEGLGIRPGSLSELVTKLEDKGLLQREQDGEDKRRVLLHLTDAGRAAASEAPSPRERDSRFDVLTEQERDSLRAILTKLLESREQLKPEE